MTPRFFFGFLAALLLAGVLLLFGRPVSEHFSKKVVPEKKKTPAQIAQVIEVIGVATAKKSYSNRLVALENQRLPYVLHHQDRLQLMSGSLVRVLLASGSEVILNENTEAFIEYFKPNDVLSPVYVFISKGNLTVSKPGVPGRLFIVKNRKVLSPTQLAQEGPENLRSVQVQNSNSQSGHIEIEKTRNSQAQPSTEPETENQDPRPRALSPTMKVGDRETLTNDYIETRLAAQSNQFRRCQINSLRDRETAIGRLIFSLKIEPSGKVSEANVVSRTRAAQTLQSCVRDVILRTTFQPFESQAILIQYPIDFE